MRDLRGLASALFAGLLLLLPFVAVAQDGPAPLAWVNVTTVKPGTQAQYEAAIGKFVAAFKKTKSAVRWTTFSSTVGGQGPTYFVAVPMQKFGDIDGWATPAATLTEAFGEEEAQQILQSMAGASQQSETVIMGARPDLSNLPAVGAGQAPAPLGYVFTTTLKPGGAPRYEAAFKKTIEAYQKTNSPIKWTTSVSAVGGPGQAYVSIIPMQTFGEIDAWQGIAPPAVLAKAFGEAEARKILQSLNESSQGTQTSIISFRPELSYQ